jgi:drug/metabolite transporter (DMT)-like permease
MAMTASPTLQLQQSDAATRPPAGPRFRSHHARTVVGLLLALGAAGAMGSTAPAMKVLGSNGLSAVNVVQARTLIAAVALMTLALALRRGRVRIGRDAWWLVGMFGLVSLAINHVVFTMSLSRLSVGVALLLEYLAPLLVALWVRFVQGQPVSLLVWVGMAGTLLGLTLVCRVGAGSALDGVGLVLGLLAAVTMASRFVLVQRGLRRHDPLVLAAWATTASAVASMLILLVDPFPTAVLASQVDLHHMHAPMMALVVWIGLVGSAGGILLSVAAQRVLAPTSVSLVLTLEIVAGAGLAFLFLGEALTGPQVVGGVVMLAGVAVAQVATALRPVRRAGRQSFD